MHWHSQSGSASYRHTDRYTLTRPLSCHLCSMDKGFIGMDQGWLNYRISATATEHQNKTILIPTNRNYAHNLRLAAILSLLESQKLSVKLLNSALLLVTKTVAVTY